MCYPPGWLYVGTDTASLPVINYTFTFARVRRPETGWHSAKVSSNQLPIRQDNSFCRSPALEKNLGEPLPWYVFALHLLAFISLLPFCVRLEYLGSVHLMYIVHFFEGARTRLFARSTIGKPRYKLQSWVVRALKQSSPPPPRLPIRSYFKKRRSCSLLLTTS